MRRYAALVGVTLAVLTWAAPARAQETDLKKVSYNMANNLGMLRTLREVDSLMTVEFWGSGTMRDVGAKTIGPVVQLKSVYGQLAYDFPGMRVEYVRSTGEREIQVVSGMFAWNEIDKIGGGLDPAWGRATPALEALSERLLRLWTTPFGVVKAARAAGEKAKVTVESGATVVTFPLAGGKPDDTVYMVVGDLEGTPVKLTLDASYRPSRVEVRYRDRTYVTTYADYGDLNDADYKADIFFPARIMRTVDGQSVLDLTIQRTNTYNPYVIMPVPDSVQKVAAR
ncbi:MAG: hypothetical protein HY824_03265 [Acidobacteria bacterium]|nr:hypothetical protein [Acidobacteriota bacterium]